MCSWCPVQNGATLQSPNHQISDGFFTITVRIDVPNETHNSHNRHWVSREDLGVSREDLGVSREDLVNSPKNLADSTTHYKEQL